VATWSLSWLALALVRRYIQQHILQQQQQQQQQQQPQEGVELRSDGGASHSTNTIGSTSIVSTRGSNTDDVRSRSGRAVPPLSLPTQTSPNKNKLNNNNPNSNPNPNPNSSPNLNLHQPQLQFHFGSDDHAEESHAAYDGGEDLPRLGSSLPNSSTTSTSSSSSSSATTATPSASPSALLVVERVIIVIRSLVGWVWYLHLVSAEVSTLFCHNHSGTANHSQLPNHF